MSDADLELLARYTGKGMEEAFAEIVRRHLDLVFSAALREVRSPELAEEVAQSVFSDLAREAHRLRPDTVLAAWLYRVACRTAIDVVRREARRQLREQVAVELTAMNAPAADWTHVEPLLDEAMHSLDEADRSAVLLRYFKNKSLREVGETLGTSEEAARKRVTRAVERLRRFFSKRGVAVGASGLVVAISANAIQAAPAGLATSISASVLSAKAMAVAATSGVSTLTGASKAAAVAKGAMGLGSLGGFLAVLGGACVTLSAQAGDTKSPRERRFLLQMIGLRIVSVLPSLAALAAIWRIPHDSLAHQSAFAGFLFLCALGITALFDYTSRRQRRIQIEDGTWVEAEWSLPRKETERASGASSPMRRQLKAARFLAFFLAWFAVMGLAAPWKQDRVGAVIISGGLALTLGLALWDWQRRPRFQSLGACSFALITGSLCGLTLLYYNLRQHEPEVRSPNSPTSSEAVLFNAAVVAAYAALFGIFAWKHRRPYDRGQRPDPE